MQSFRMIVALLALLYVLSPVDAIPDFIPVVGWADDLLVGLVGLIALLCGARGSTPQSVDWGTQTFRRPMNPTSFHRPGNASAAPWPRIDSDRRS